MPKEPTKEYAATKQKVNGSGAVRLKKPALDGDDSWELDSWLLRKASVYAVWWRPQVQPPPAKKEKKSGKSERADG